MIDDKITDRLPPVFDTRTLARWSGIEPRRWMELRRDGMGPAFFRMGSRQVLYTRDALSEWLRAGSQTRTEPTTKAKPQRTANAPGLNSTLSSKKGTEQHDT
jgi:hypothetical protein